MSLANEAVTANGNAMANQEKYEESFAGRLQEVQTRLDTFWISLYKDEAVNGILKFLNSLITGFNDLSDSIGAIPALLTGVASVLTAKSVIKSGSRPKVGFNEYATGKLTVRFTSNINIMRTSVVKTG